MGARRRAGIRQMMPNLVRLWLPRQIPGDGFINGRETGISKQAFLRRFGLLQGYQIVL
jgi:hypothetical protein